MLLQWWRSRVGSHGVRPSPKVKRHRLRLDIEPLEERSVPTVTAISVAAGPLPASATADGASSNAVLNSNGRFVAFQSNGSDLVAGEVNGNGALNIYLRDQLLQTTTLITHSTVSNTITANNNSTNPVISGDGRFVAFQSAATDLISGAAITSGPNATNIYLFDRLTGTTTLVSHANGTALATGDATSFDPFISSNGNFITFVSNADNLATGGQTDTNGGSDVFLYDVNAGSIALVSHSTAGAGTAGNDVSGNPSISSDGAFIAYESNATNLASGLTITTGVTQIFEYSRASNANKLVSHNSLNASKGGNAVSLNSSISGDGGRVVYQSNATDLVAGQSNAGSITDVFEYNLSTGANIMLSHSTTGAAAAGNAASDQAVISANGKVVVFRSLATDLVIGQLQSNSVSNVFLYSNITGATTLVSHAAGSSTITGDGASSNPAVSADGNSVVFLSAATNLISGLNKQDGSGSDVYVFNLVTGTVRLVTPAFGFTTITASAGSDQPTISSDSTFIAFRSAAANLTASDLNAMPDVFGFANHTDDLIAEIAGNNQILLNVSNGSSFLPQTVVITLPAGGNYTAPLLGDFNGDGHQDVAVRDINTGIWYVSLSDGGGNFSAPAAWTQWVPGNVWADVQVGNFDGSSRTQIVGRYLPNGQWWVAQSNGTAFTNTLWTTWVPDFAGLHWVDVMVGDVTGQGTDDIVGRFLETGQWWVAVPNGSVTDNNRFSNFLWTTWSPQVQWVDVHLGDFTGDGKEDIVGRIASSAQWWVAVSTGIKFNNFLWAQWSNTAIWTNVVIGDFNGDGKMDVAGRLATTGQWWIALSRGNAFNTSLWLTWPGPDWVDVQAGDFNGDGYADLAGRDPLTGQWQVGLSNGSSLFNSSVWTTWSTAFTWTGVTHGAFV
jgi:hypothetical protein